MSEEKRERSGLEFVISDDGNPESEQAANREEILSIGRWASRTGHIGTWVDGDRLDSLLPIADAARKMGGSESKLKLAIEEGLILTVDDGTGEHLVPGFQLAGDFDVLGPVVARVSALLKPVCATTRTIWLWFLSPKTELGGRVPAEWIAQNNDPSPVLLAAERDAQRLGD